VDAVAAPPPEAVPDYLGTNRPARHQKIRCPHNRNDWQDCYNPFNWSIGWKWQLKKIRHDRRTAKSIDCEKQIDLKIPHELSDIKFGTNLSIGLKGLYETPSRAASAGDRNSSTPFLLSLLRCSMEVP
jgi:hypothetical protein